MLGSNGKIASEWFAERLKEYRTEKGFTQEQIAEKLGVTRMTYSYYENAKRTPDIEFLYSMHILSGYTMEYLLGKSECRTMQEEAEALQLVPDSENGTDIATQKAYLITRMAKSLLAKYASEGECVVDDYLLPLAELSNAIEEMLRGFTYEKNSHGEWVKTMYADYFFDKEKKLYLKARKACSDILEGGF